MPKPKPYVCRVTNLDVVLKKVPLLPICGGIGSANAWVQYDYGCSQESKCPLRTSPACKVRQLNEQ